MKYQPFLIIFAFFFTSPSIPSSMPQHFVSIIPTQQSISRWGGTKSEMRYANTKILIVTCYLLPQGWKCRCAFALASLCLRFRFAPIDGASTDLQRTYNGFTTEVERYCIGGCTRAFFAFLHRFLCGVNEFSMMSTKSGLCKPLKENDNLSSAMSTNAV